MKLRWTRAALLPLAPAAGVLLAVAGAGPVHAIGTTLSVTGLLDTGGACVGTVCPTLRAAIHQANLDSVPDTITLPAGTYTLSDGSIEIDKSMTITGAGAATTIIHQTTCGSRIFTIDLDATKPVSISGVTLTGGNVATSGDSDFTSGGAIVITDKSQVTLNHDVITGNGTNGNGGGVSVHKDNASLTVLDTIIKNNHAGAGIICETSSPTPSLSISTQDGPQSGPADGGGIWAEGTLTVHNSTINGNTASGNGGGLHLSPPSGAIDALSQVFIHHNTAMGGVESIDSGGGGIYDEMEPGAHLAIDHSTISNNTAVHGNGGGDYEDFSSRSPEIAAKVATVTPPQVTISSTTFNGNTATGWPGLGGALYVHDGANVLTTNDTITGNTARNGGGIAIGQSVATSHLALENDTIDANRANNSGPLAAGGLFLPDGVTTIHNTIVVNDRASQLKVATVLHNCWVGEALLTSLGWNLADDTTCNLTHAGDQLPPSANAALGTLQDNGGVLDGANGDTSPTLTQALGHGSTALDLADPTTFPATDERGVTRPQLAPASLLLVHANVAHVSVTPRADIGAYEAAQATTTTTTPTPSPGVHTNPTPRSGVQGIISVPKTGANPDETLPLGAMLAVAGLLSVATGAFLARRRR